MQRTLPSATSSASAPTVSSIGVVGIDAVLLVEVDRLDAEPPQARLAGLADVLGAAVEPGDPLAGTDDAELRREHDLVAATAIARPTSSSLCPSP